MKHPIIDTTSKSTYYNNKDGVNEIFIREQITSVASMMGFVVEVIAKYETRLGKKSLINGSIKEVMDLYFIHRPEMYEFFIEEHKQEVKQSDLKKIATYKAYGEALKDLLHKGYKNHTVSHAYELEGISFDY